MRNWNGNICKFNESFLNWFLSYLWGIETVPCPTLWELGVGSFYRTYEELKHHRYQNHKLAVHGFYRTYEELKLNCLPAPAVLSRSFLSYLWGIETDTYKHLLYCFLPVFIVPMRNWNSTKMNKSDTGRTFLSYLWGIETIRIIGHETWYPLRFYRTYEELKPNI